MTNIKTEKAIVAQIKYAGLEFEGLMFPDGKYGISFAQVDRLLNLGLQKNLTRGLKSLFPKGFSDFRKESTEINSNQVWVLYLNEFSVLLSLLSSSNDIALKFTIASSYEKLERIFDSAFGIIVNERERELRFAARIASKVTFRPLTDCLKAHGFDQKSKHLNKRYSTYIWELQTALDIKSGTRDDINATELMRLVTVQSKLTGMIEARVDPWDALSTVIQSINEGLL